MEQEAKITTTVAELENLLNEHKRIVADYITRNLSVYSWFADTSKDISQMKDEITAQVMKSGFPQDIIILKKYHK